MSRYSASHKIMGGLLLFIVVLGVIVHTFFL